MRLDAGPALIVAAHPDDETIGMGGVLPLVVEPYIVHVTDGAPENGADARAAGLGGRAEYAAARRAEVACAMRFAGVLANRMCELGIVDQRASHNMAEIVRRIARILDQRRPAFVFTHPYEGGHPDHDATAFAVHAACRTVERPPSIIEFTSYHDRNGQMETGQFLEAGPEVVEYALDEGARRRKCAMFGCFATQRQMLDCFGTDVERFRPAPAYDFTLPPHAGTLWYERFAWGVTGEQFRKLAVEALSSLGLGAAA